MELLKLKDASKLLNISYPTIKQWIYRGKIHSIKTPGGHHRIPLSEIERLTGSIRTPHARGKLVDLDAISLRNKLTGVITEIQLVGLFAQVKMSIEEQEVLAIIPRQAHQSLELKKGEPIIALFKAVDVMIIRG